MTDLSPGLSTLLLSVNICAVGVSSSLQRALFADVVRIIHLVCVCLCPDVYTYREAVQLISGQLLTHIHTHRLM